MKVYTLKIVHIIEETLDTKTICFKQPSLKRIKYQAGQYLTLIFRINGRRYIRPYSFSSAPDIDDLLMVTVKRVLNGVVSNHIHDSVQIGDVIEVFEPMGDFTFQTGEEINAVYFWGAGSGITPLISLIKFVLNINPLITVNLIYGNRNHETTIFSSLINELLFAYPDKFRVWLFHTYLAIKESNPLIIEGRINQDYAERILTDVSLKDSRHYICGPAGLKESVKAVLNIKRIPEQHVFSEDFELIKDPKEFIDIITREIRLKHQNNEYILEVPKGKSILESSLDAGIELPYSCQTGNCNTCKAICSNGKVRMIGLTKSRIHLDENEYLLCCSYPLTDDIYIEI